MKAIQMDMIINMATEPMSDSIVRPLSLFPYVFSTSELVGELKHTKTGPAMTSQITIISKVMAFKY